MENKIYDLNELEEQYPEQQPIHRIVLFGHRYIIRQSAYEVYEAIGEGLTMLFGVGSIFTLLFFFLFIAQK